MKINPNILYSTKQEAQDGIDSFKECHPKSKKKYTIIKEVYYLIEEL